MDCYKSFIVIFVNTDAMFVIMSYDISVKTDKFVGVKICI